MHTIEPFYNWRDYYTAEEDEKSPFYGRQYSEFEFSNVIYNYYIHPQWDEFGSRTLYLKILFIDYTKHFAIIEFIGEWNDAIENDIMTLKREIIDHLESYGIWKFVLIGENVLNFHSGGTDYYEEWYEEVRENKGWIIMINMPETSLYDFRNDGITHFVELTNVPEWRTYHPKLLYKKIEGIVSHKLN